MTPAASPPAGLAIRPIPPGNEPAILEMWCSAWEAFVPGVDLRAHWDVLEQQWAELMAAGALSFMAELDGRIAGILVLDRSRRCLEQIAVAPGLTSRGIGTALILFAQATSDGRLELVVNTFNTHAARLYERCGFHRTGEHIDEGSGLPVWTYVWEDAEREQPVTPAYNF